MGVENEINAISAFTLVGVEVEVEAELDNITTLVTKSRYLVGSLEVKGKLNVSPPPQPFVKNSYKIRIYSTFQYLTYN